MDILFPINEVYLELYGNNVEEDYPINFIEVVMEYEKYNKKDLLEVEEPNKVHLDYSYHEVLHT